MICWILRVGGAGPKIKDARGRSGNSQVAQAPDDGDLSKVMLRLRVLHPQRVGVQLNRDGALKTLIAGPTGKNLLSYEAVLESRAVLQTLGGQHGDLSRVPVRPVRLRGPI